MTVKRTVVWVAVFLMLFLSACSNSSSNEQVTLRYLIWGENQKPAMEEIVKAFEEDHPNIKVSIEVLPWQQYWTKLETAATGDSAADVFWMSKPNVGKYALNGIIADLSSNIEQDGIDLNMYNKTVLQNYTVDGKVYGLPKDTDGIGLWYNKELFDKAGIKYPDETWDLAKLREAAKALTNPAEGIYGIAANMEGNMTFYHTMYQMGGFVISDDLTKSGYDDPGSIEGLRHWVEIINVDKSSPTLAQMSETSPSDLFTSGKLAMIYEGSWMSSTYAENEYTKDRVDVTMLPQGTERGVATMGLSNSMNAKTKHPKEAWQFLSFLGSKEAAEIQGSTGTIIPAVVGTEHLWVEAFPQYNLQAFIDQMEYTRPYPASIGGTWEQPTNEILMKAWAGEIPVEDAAKQMAQVMNELLAEENE